MNTGLYAVKPWFVSRLRRAEDVLVARRVRPDALTYAAIVASTGASGVIVAGALLEAPVLWILVAPLGLIRLALNALDGSVARRTKRISDFGAALNEVCDRVSDIALIASTLAVAPPELVLAAMTLTLLVSVAGMSGVSASGTRSYAGPMGKADRVAVISLGGVVAALTASALAFQLALLVLCAGSSVTFVLRMKEVRRRCS
jgi:CDP-diacylglycerol---glycerol-3-phosphate 3-phosphatidyltransferase